MINENIAIFNKNILFSQNVLMFFNILFLLFFTINNSLAFFIVTCIVLTILIFVLKTLDDFYELEGLAIAFQVAFLLRMTLLFIIFLCSMGDIENVFCNLINVDSIEYFRKSFMDAQTIEDQVFGINAGYALWLNFLVNTFQLEESNAIYIFCIPQLIISSLLPVIAVIAMRTITHKKKALRFIFWLACCDVMMLRFSFMLMKDVLTAFLVSVGIISFYNAKKIKNLLIAITILLLATYLSSLVRLRSLLVIGSYAVVSLTFHLQGRLRKTVGIVGAVVFFLAGAYFIFQSSLTSDLGMKSLEILSVADAWQQRVDNLGPESTGRLAYYINSFPYPIMVSIKFILGILQPMPPIQMFRVSDELMFVQSFFDLGAIWWHFWLPSLVYGIWRLYKDKVWLPILCFVILMSGMALSGWMDVRWRLMTIVPIYIFTTIGYLRGANTNILSKCYYAILILITLIY